jgi:chromosomal replication initiator protein
MYLLREELNYSYPFIGEKLGGRDHTTAMYAYDRVLKEIEKNDNFKNEINIIRANIYNNT